MVVPPAPRPSCGLLGWVIAAAVCCLWVVDRHHRVPSEGGVTAIKNHLPSRSPPPPSHCRCNGASTWMQCLVAQCEADTPPGWTYGCALPVSRVHADFEGACGCQRDRLLFHKKTAVWRCEALPKSCGVPSVSAATQATDGDSTCGLNGGADSANQSLATFDNTLGYPSARTLAFYSQWDTATASRCENSTNAFCSLLSVLEKSTAAARSVLVMSQRHAIPRLPPPKSPEAFETTLLHHPGPLKLQPMLPLLNLTKLATWNELLELIEKHDNVNGRGPLKIFRSHTATASGDPQGEPMLPYLQQMLASAVAGDTNRIFDLRPWHLRGEGNKDELAKLIGFRHPGTLIVDLTLGCPSGTRWFISCYTVIRCHR